MSIYFVGIDIAKYNHHCCIISASDQSIVSSFVFPNDKKDFEPFLSALQFLSEDKEIRIGLNLPLITRLISNS